MGGWELDRYFWPAVLVRAPGRSPAGPETITTLLRLILLSKVIFSLGIHMETEELTPGYKLALSPPCALLPFSQ